MCYPRVYNHFLALIPNKVKVETRGYPVVSILRLVGVRPFFSFKDVSHAWPPICQFRGYLDELIFQTAKKYQSTLFCAYMICRCERVGYHFFF